MQLPSSISKKVSFIYFNLAFLVIFTPAIGGQLLFVTIELVLMKLLKCDQLDCFNCTDINDLSRCHSTVTCRIDEFCYTESYIADDGNKLFILGCKPKQFCVGLDQTDLFVGRRRGADDCVQCCHLHGCNKYLCPVQFTAAPPAVDGGWSKWGSWGACSSSCGIGLQSRTRNCDNPLPSYNGRLCLGDAKDISLCTVPCTEPSIRPTIRDSGNGTSMATTSESGNTPPSTASSNYVTADLTQKPGECEDLIDCSGYYRPEACHGIYEPWAQRYCPVHCGFCPTVSPIPCVDTITNCKEYQSDVCTSKAFWQWRESHCRKFCQLC